MTDPWQAISEISRVWVPVIGTATVVYRVYSTSKKTITGFFDKLLDNHLSHVQASLDSLYILQKEQNEILKEILHKN
jgi:hypothetical protein